MKAQMHRQSSMKTSKQKIPKGKLIVTEAQAKKAIATGKYLLHKALLYHTNHTDKQLDNIESKEICKMYTTDVCAGTKYCTLGVCHYTIGGGRGR
jgi:hypothetical protein